MHSITEVGSNVPAFLAKLWKLVEDAEFDELICWSEVRYFHGVLHHILYINLGLDG